eukprot:15219654-Ditylum_brightwellii.AAC.1
MNHLNYTVDYQNTVFEKPELAHVHGKPTMVSLLTLCNEIWANAQSLSTMLGSRQHDHLGLVMTAQDYALVPSTTAYVRPPQPMLILSQNGTQYQITQAKEQYYDKFCMFNKCNTMEKILIQQI